jgi:outer membrane protein OmpA-like peptidoglycan-associated protein
MPPVAGRHHLSAAIHVRGVNDQGELYEGPVIEIEEAPWSETVPIIPYVFFEPGETSIPERYVQLENSSKADDFSLDSTIDISPLDIHWQLLNVVGRRMRSQPDVTLTISGRSSGEEMNPEVLERSRAESVRDYLTGIWGIDPDRIAIAGPVPGSAASEITEDGREENRRAELRFSSPEIVRPVVIERMARIASPPSIRFLPEIVADSLVKEWIITIFQGEKELVRFTGSSDRESLRQSRMWELADTRVNRDLTPIGYRLYVRDVTGKVAEAEGRFQVTERITRRDDSLARRRQVRQYPIVGFNYDSPTLLDRHLQDLREVADEISSDAIVSITGYTDRVGNPERNRQLSLERAQMVRRELLELLRIAQRPGPIDLVVQGYGGGAVPFDNNLPEGRILSRMVKVTITR